MSDFSAFVDPPKEEVRPEGFAAYVDSTPLDRVSGRSINPRVDTFKGDSDYDEGLVFGMDQMRNRARNQPWYDQVGNQAVKLAPAIALGIVENAGYLGELFDNTNDYSNAVTELAIKARTGLDDAFTNYREDPNAVFDLGDSAWWIQHGGGLVESVGEFLVTGAGVGGALGKGARGLAQVLKANALITSGLKGAAQLGTAGLLAYTEGAMSGAQIYKEVMAEVNNPESELFNNPTLAQERAAEAASRTVRLNTTINTVLNATSVAPMFRTANSLTQVAKAGMKRLAGETRAQWMSRIDDLVSQGYTPAALRKTLLLEAGQEAMEEEVNLFAEGEGRIAGGIKKAEWRDPISRFLASTFTAEGALSGMLGALGGVAQTAGMELIPMRRQQNEDGTTSRISNRAFEINEGNKQLIETAELLKQDIQALNEAQEVLDAAVKTGDKNAIFKAREDLFNVSLNRHIRNGTAEEFTEDLKQISQTDNSTLGEDGMTEAMRRGYADSENDSEYKRIASQKIQDIRELTKEYENIAARFTDPLAANKVFNQRLNLYSTQNLYNRLTTENTEITNNINRLVRGTNILQDAQDDVAIELVNRAANVNALSFIIQSLQQTEDPTFIQNIKNTLAVEQKVLDDLLSVTPDGNKKLQDNLGLVQQLTIARAPVLKVAEEVNREKGRYNDLLDNTGRTVREARKELEDIQKELNKREEERVKAEEKDKEKTDKQQVKEQVKQAEEKKAKPEEKKADKPKAKVTREKIGDFTIIAKPDGTATIFDDDANQELEDAPSMVEARKRVRQLNKENEAARKQEELPPPINEDDDPLNRLPVVLPPPPTKKVDTTPAKPTVKEQKIITKEEEKITRQPNPTDFSTAPNKVFSLNEERFAWANDPNITEGSEIVLRVDTEHSNYKKKSTANTAPIGMFTPDGKLLGYLNQYDKKRDSASLPALRKYIFDNGPVTTTISNKTLGFINRVGEKQTVDALPGPHEFIVGRNSKFYTGRGELIPTEMQLVNDPKKVKEGGMTYLLLKGANGKNFAAPVDSKQLTEEIVESIVLALDSFINAKEYKGDPTIDAFNERVRREYDIDLTTAQGFAKYFKFWLNSVDLTQGDLILKAREGDENGEFPTKAWVEWTGNGIAFYDSTTDTDRDTPWEIGINTPADRQEGLLSKLREHLKKTYFEVNLTPLGTNEAVNMPILYPNTETETIEVKPYQKATYAEHVASITETDLKPIMLPDGRATYFHSPLTYFNTGFLGEEAQQNVGNPFVVVEESPKLETKPTVDPTLAPKTMAKIPTGKSRFEKRGLPPGQRDLFKSYCS